jgi:hypothetical protein
MADAAQPQTENNMNAAKAKEILDKVVGVVFGFQNPLSLEQAREKFAFDRRLPQQVYDSTTNQPTWTESVNQNKFMKLDNVLNRPDEFMLPARPLNSLEDILTAWGETNYTATERYNSSTNVAESDNIMYSENIYRSFDLHRCKNVIFTESGSDLEYIVGGFSSATSSFCIRVEQSQLTTNSFNVIWSAKVSNSMFMQNCFDCLDCMFCSHLSGKRFCIANMQFDEAEYHRLREQVVKWVLTS